MLAGYDMEIMKAQDTQTIHMRDLRTERDNQTVSLTAVCKNCIKYLTINTYRQKRHLDQQLIDYRILVEV